MPWRTSACSTGSRCRGGRRWRVARDLAATGRPCALSAMSMTAAMAKAPLRGRSGMRFPKIGETAAKTKLVGPSFSSRARRTKTPNSACCFIKTCDFADRGLQGCYQHQLCNARAALHRERVMAEIRKDYMNFAAVIGVDRARRIEHRDAVVQCEPRPRPDLALNPCGQREGEPGRDRGAPTRRDEDGRTGGHRGEEVEPGRVRAVIGRER